MKKILAIALVLIMMLSVVACGDKQQKAYDSLVDWVLENGKVYGDDAEIRDGNYFLLYSASEETLHVGYTDNTRTVSVNLFAKDKVFNYWYYYKGVRIAQGTIDGSTYTAESPIKCEVYNGASEYRSKHLDDARIYCNSAIRWLKKYLEENVPEISIKDLGFEVY